MNESVQTARPTVGIGDVVKGQCVSTECDGAKVEGVVIDVWDDDTLSVRTEDVLGTVTVHVVREYVLTMTVAQRVGAW